MVIAHVDTAANREPPPTYRLEKHRLRLLFLLLHLRLLLVPPTLLTLLLLHLRLSSLHLRALLLQLIVGRGGRRGGIRGSHDGYCSHCGGRFPEIVRRV
jgi:hypothetical protein